VLCYIAEYKVQYSKVHVEACKVKYPVCAALSAKEIWQRF